MINTIKTAKFFCEMKQVILHTVHNEKCVILSTWTKIKAE